MRLSLRQKDEITDRVCLALARLPSDMRSKKLTYNYARLVTRIVVQRDLTRMG